LRKRRGLRRNFSDITRREIAIPQIRLVEIYIRRNILRRNLVGNLAHIPLWEDIDKIREIFEGVVGRIVEPIEVPVHQ